jgi:hypothetical protein
MKIEEITEITGKTREEVENILNSKDFLNLELTEK